MRNELTIKEIMETSILILSSGKIHDDLTCIFGDIPTGLIPINQRPVISVLIDVLLRNGFNDINITVGYKKEMLIKIINNLYKKKNLKFFESDYTKKPGFTLINTVKNLEGNSVLVILSDTLINSELLRCLKLNKSFIIASKNYYKSDRWCLVSRDLKKIYDKEENVTEPLLAVVGIYYFKNLNLLKSLANNFKNSGMENIEISTIIKEYNKYDKIEVVEVDSWEDLGHLENYYKAKQNLISSRFFNKIKANLFFGTITKTSEDNIKLNNEIEWYLNLPKELKPFAPAIYDYSISAVNSFVTMEYIGYQKLSELWLYSSMDEKIWFVIIDKLVKVLDLFNKNRGNVSLEDYKYIYVKKTLERLTMTNKQNLLIRKLSEYKKLEINGTEFKNFPLLLKSLDNVVNLLYSENHNCYVHGDFCFSNIFYDVHTGLTKLVDPRGKWASSHYGDIKYDYAKLRHSISGNYEFIVHDLFDIKITANKIFIDIPKNQLHNKIATYYDNKIKEFMELEKIKLIEGLLFLSMIPLHKDNLKRQIAMLCRGVELLNNVSHLLD